MSSYKKSFDKKCNLVKFSMFVNFYILKQIMMSQKTNWLKSNDFEEITCPAGTTVRTRDGDVPLKLFRKVVGDHSILVCNCLDSYVYGNNQTF